MNFEEIKTEVVTVKIGPKWWQFRKRFRWWRMIRRDQKRRARMSPEARAVADKFWDDFENQVIFGDPESIEVSDLEYEARKKAKLLGEWPEDIPVDLQKANPNAAVDLDKLLEEPPDTDYPQNY